MGLNIYKILLRFNRKKCHLEFCLEIWIQDFEFKCLEFSGRNPNILGFPNWMIELAPKQVVYIILTDWQQLTLIKQMYCVDMQHRHYWEVLRSHVFYFYGFDLWHSYVVLILFQSEEDKQLQEDLEMMVERLSVSIHISPTSLCVEVWNKFLQSKNIFGLLFFFTFAGGKHSTVSSCIRRTAQTDSFLNHLHDLST